MFPEREKQRPAEPVRSPVPEARNPRPGEEEIGKSVPAGTAAEPEPEGAAGILRGRLAGEDGSTDVGFTRLGVFRLERPLGRGGMGEVYLAWDERLERHVALKRIHPARLEDPKARKRFRREARSVARLSHPAIVQIYDILELEGAEHLVMEHVEGRSLSEVIARGEVDLERTLDLAFEIAEALVEANAKGLVHRDLKPGNVMVTHSGHAKVLDFGLARALDSFEDSEESKASLTEPGALVGTAHAMSPEQAMGQAVDHRSDLFAFGTLLYTMLSGQAPFRGRNVLESLRRVTSEAPVPIGELVPELPPALAELIGDLLAKDPALRPRNARKVVEALTAIRKAPSASLHLEGFDVAQAETMTDLPAMVDSREFSSTIKVLVATMLPRHSGPQDHSGSASRGKWSLEADQHARDLLSRFGGQEVDKQGGLLLLFDRPAEAVAFALAYQAAVARMDLEGASSSGARIGVHLGELEIRHNRPADMQLGARPLEVAGGCKDAALHLAQLAGEGQILISRAAFDLARRAEDQNELADGGLTWLAHGTYLCEGLADPLEICEVGLADFAPLSQPPDSAAARRVLALGEELTLGWRPAPGQAVPRRPNWSLTERLGEGGFGEVWLARHKSGESRVFKFCFEAERLRALKREVTLFRLLKEALGHRRDIARILDWSFDEAPYFLESEYTAGGSLPQWAKSQGGLENVPLERRLELAAQVAEALAAAHSVGILHKDVKPENVLVSLDREGNPSACLTDFGIGLLTERERLQDPGFTALGFTETLTSTEASGTGTLGYLAPELMEGKAATVQADIYSLGVLLYQLRVGDFSRALAPGWERDINDPILAADIAGIVDGQAERRPASAKEVADKLRSLGARRQEALARERRLEVSQRAERRKKVLSIVAGTSTFFLIIVALVATQALRSRSEAQQERQQAEGLIDFMLFDLHESLSPVGRLDLLDKVAASSLEYFRQTASRGGDEALYKRALTLVNIGKILYSKANIASSLEAYRNAADLLHEIVKRNPERLEWYEGLSRVQSGLGSCLLRQGDLPAALDAYSIARDHAEKLSFHASLGPTKVPALLTRAELGVARAYLQQGQEPEALEWTKKALERAREPIRGVHEDIELRGLEMESRVMYGLVLFTAGENATARSFNTQTKERLEELIRAEPANLIWRQKTAIVDSQLGLIAWTGQDLDSAAAAMRRALAGYQQLSLVDPTNDVWKTGTAQVQIYLGRILFSLGSVERPRELFDAALVSLGELAEKDPGRVTLHRWRARALNAKGRLWSSQGELAQAASTLLQACRQYEKAAGLALEDVLLQNDLSWCLVGLGRAHAATGATAAARQAWTRAVEVIAPVTRIDDHSSLLDTHAQALLELGREEEARPLVEKLLARGWSQSKFLELAATLEGRQRKETMPEKH